jgi:hypothetical protein
MGGEAMKILTSTSEELIDIDMQISGKDKTCKPVLSISNYVIDGPVVQISMQRDQRADGLLINVELPDVIGMRLLIDLNDIKQLKTLINKDVIKFMIKALIWPLNRR